MSRGIKSKIFLLGIPLLLVIAILMLSSPNDIDWSLSFSKDHTKPFGGQMLFELMNEITEDHLLQTAYSDLTTYFDTLPDQSNLIIINHTFLPEEYEIETLLELVNKGNNIFIASTFLTNRLADTLRVRTNQLNRLQLMSPDSISFNLANKKLRTPLGYWYPNRMTDYYFTDYDSLRTTVLGINTEGKTNFIRQKHGDGWLYLHLNPQAFTNYHLLNNDNYQYAFKCLSYLPSQTTVWDEHYKMRHSAGKRSSLLGYLLSNPPMRLAWYLLLITVALFFIFNSARRQRSIPVITPPENSTISFAETIGRLYFNRKNHLDIAQKRFRYLQAFIRNHYYINTSEINDEIYEQLADKSSIPVRSLKQLFDMGNKLSRVKHLGEEDLEQFNRRIEYFYEHCQ